MENGTANDVPEAARDGEENGTSTALNVEGKEGDAPAELQNLPEEDNVILE